MSIDSRLQHSLTPVGKMLSVLAVGMLMMQAVVALMMPPPPLGPPPGWAERQAAQKKADKDIDMDDGGSTIAPPSLATSRPATSTSTLAAASAPATRQIGDADSGSDLETHVTSKRSSTRSNKAKGAGHRKKMEERTRRFKEAQGITWTEATPGAVAVEATAKMFFVCHVCCGSDAVFFYTVLVTL